MERPLHLLFFGNSYTINNGVAERVAALAEAAGHPRPRCVVEVEGGQNLARHIDRVVRMPRENADHPSLGNGETWDFVVLQEFSWRPTHLGAPTQFRRDAAELFRLTRDHASGRGRDARAVLYQTWARAAGHAFYDADFADAAAMQRELRANYAAALDDLATIGARPRIAAAGEAFEALAFDPALYDEDLHHPSARGSTLAAMTLFRAIYDAGVGPIRFADVATWAGVDASTWRALAGVADGVTIGRGDLQRAAS